MADRERIRIWHTYPIDLVRPGARKPERRVAAAPIDVEVRTAETAELAIASRFRTCTRHQTWKGDVEGGPVVALYGFDGALWTPLPGIAGSVPATLEQWQAAMAGGPLLHEPYELTDPILAAQFATQSGSVTGWDGVVRLEETEGRVVADDRRRGAEAAIRAADNVLLVDGRVWRRAERPFWSVERDGTQHVVFLRWHRNAKDQFHFSGADVLGTFGADRLDEAMAFARDIAKARGRRAEVKGPGGVCLDHVPEHADRNDRVANALELGEPLIDKLGDLVRAMSTTGIEAYVEARTLLGRLAVGDGDADTVTHLAATFAAVVEDLDRFEFPLVSVDARDELKRNALKTFTTRMAAFGTVPEAAPPHPTL